MALKILAVGDIHAKVSAIWEVNILKDTLRSIIQKYDVKQLVILGDMSDQFEKMHLQTWNCIISFFQDISQVVDNIYYIVGNHDLVHHSAAGTSEHFFNALKLFPKVTVIDSFQEVWIDGVKTVMCPYLPPGELVKLYKSQNPQAVRLVFSHQEFYGSLLGAIKSEHGDVWSVDLPFVINGHIHERSSPYPNVLNVGSPRYTSFGETSQRSVSLLEVDTGSVRETPIPVKMPKKHTIKTSVKDIPEIEIDHPEDIVRIIIEDKETVINTFKLSEKYNKLKNNKNIKLVLKPLIQTKVNKNINNLKFDELLVDKCKGDEFLHRALQDVLNAFNTGKL